MSAPQSTFTGFTFDDSDERNTEALKTTVNGDGSTVLKLYYTRNSYDIELAGDDYDWAEPAAQTTWEYQDTVNLALESREGYTATWTAKQDGKIFASDMNEAVSFQMPAEDVLVTPDYQPVEVTVSRAKLKQVDFQGDPKAYYEQAFSATLVADTGYRLPDTISITVGGEPLEASQFTYGQGTGGVTIIKGVITGTVEITAEGVPVTFEAEVKFENNTQDGQPILTANPEKAQVKGGEILADGSLMLSLYYKRSECTLTVTAEEGITATANGEPGADGTYRYHYGETVEVKVTGVAQGKSFLGWYRGGALQTAAKKYSFIITENTTLVAKSGEGAYELVVNGSHGTHDFQNGTGYEAGIKFDQTRDFIITPNAGYHRPKTVTYTVDGEPSGDVEYNAETGAVKLTVKGDAAFQFAMDPNTYTLTLDPCGGQLSQTTLTVTFDAPYGELPEPYRSGYRFTGWYTAQQGGDLVEAETIYKEVGDQTLYAQWEKRSSGGGGGGGRPLLPPSDPQTEIQPPVVLEPVVPVEQGTPVSGSAQAIQPAQPETGQPANAPENGQPAEPPAEETITPEPPASAQEAGKPFVLLNAVGTLLAVLLAAFGRSKGKRRGGAAGCAVGAAAITLLTLGWDGIAVANLWTIPVAVLTLSAGYFSRQPQATQEKPQDPA